MFSYSHVDRHLDPFHFFAIMNKVALIIAVYVVWYTHMFICV